MWETIRTRKQGRHEAANMLNISRALSVVRIVRPTTNFTTGRLGIMIIGCFLIEKRVQPLRPVDHEPSRPD